MAGMNGGVLADTVAKFTADVPLCGVGDVVVLSFEFVNIAIIRWPIIVQGRRMLQIVETKSTD
jgi:hypothetical protein